MLKLPKGQNHPLRLIYKNFLRYKNGAKSEMSSNVPIDILIPVIEKDLPTLRFVVPCARKNIFNPIGNIYVVGKKGLIEKFCNETGCVFLDEETVMPLKKADIKYRGQEWFRSGWLFQQFIKLNADELVSSDNVLILDSDTCFTKKQSFVLNDETFILNFSDEYHFPYGSYGALLGVKDRFFLSFVCHHMIFNKTILRDLKKNIEDHTGKPWIDAVLNGINFEDHSCFSEYELYGNYLYHNYRNRIHLEYWRNKSLQAASLEKKDLDRYSEKFKSISLHKSA